MNQYVFVLLFLLNFFTLLIARLEPSRVGPKDERFVAYNARKSAAYVQTLAREDFFLPDENNGDAQSVPNRAAMFTKLLEHDENGTLTDQGIANYDQLVKAMSTGKQEAFNAIVRYPGSPRIYVNPQAGLALTMNGMDSSLFVMALPPKLVSAQAAVDMIEVYLNAVCRDVNFSDYGTGLNTDVDPVYGGSLTSHAAAILNDFPEYSGPRNQSGQVDATVLFRGNCAGDLVGPFVSQFALMPLYPLFVSGCVGAIAALTGVPNLPIGAFAVELQYPIASRREFGISWSDYLALQNGLIPKIYNQYDYSSNKRYSINGRDLGSYVHRDGPYETYYNALTTLISRGFPISPVLPYANGSIKNEGGGLTMGGPDAFGLLGGVTLTAFRAGWAQKWRCHMRIRPEAMAGLVHHAKVTGDNPYLLHKSLFKVHAGYDYLALVLNHNQQQAYLPYNSMPLDQASTYLLSQMYPEASPEHPSYPSGHATGAAACITVLKAIFDESTKINAKFQPVKVNPYDPTQLVLLSASEGADQLTVGSELDKLAFSISMARNFGGVHYRTDAWNGMLLGEAVAITYLQDHARIYQEQGFKGFELTKLDGTKIRITPDEVIVIG